MESASARTNSYRNGQNQSRNTQSNDRREQTQPTTRTTNDDQSKGNTPAVTQQTPVTPNPVTETVAPQAPVTPQIISPAATPRIEEVVDTAPAIAQMTQAQAVTTGQTVTYTSQKISEEIRNRLIALATVALVTGSALYVMSLFTATAPATRRTIPIRYIVPVREVTTY